MTTVSVRVPAKINLCLGVGPVREDGFHPLATVYQAVDLHDELRATVVDSDEITVTTTVDVEDAEDDPERDPAREVREAFQKSKFPPNLATERVDNDDLLAAQSANLARRRGDRDPTVIPALDTDTVLEDATVDGTRDAGAESSAAELGPVEPDEKTVVPHKANDGESTHH